MLSDLRDALERVLRVPAVADKTFLVTIGDRTVTGLVARDPMVGRFQVPAADCGVTITDYDGTTGEAMAMGERPMLALLDAAASARMAVGEAVTNLAAAAVGDLGDVKLSAKWMAAAGHPGEDARLWEAVCAVGLEVCPALGIAIPVGKDSMSMRSVWKDEAGGARSVTSPVSLIVSAFAPVLDVRRTLTPELRLDAGETELVLLDLGAGKNRLGGSCMMQAYGALGDAPPDVDDAARLRAFFAAMQELSASGLALAYHDRSDGGLVVTLLEMAFAGGSGLEIDLSSLAGDDAALLFSEELGAVVQIRADEATRVREIFARHGLASLVHSIGRPTPDDRVLVRRDGRALLDDARSRLRGVWSETTWLMQRMRDDSASADEEHAARTDASARGLSAKLTFDPGVRTAAPAIARAASRPRVAILREQGVNGQIEMAAAMHRAGFEAVDVHMTDVLSGSVDLDRFRGLVACGRFSYGDVLGAGEGWAKSILFHAEAKARLAMIRIERSPSIFFAGMDGSVLPIAVAHGEGRVEPLAEGDLALLEQGALVAARYVDGAHDARRPRDDPHAAPGARLPQRAALVAPHRLDGRRQPVDAHVRQRARVGGFDLTTSSGPFRDAECAAGPMHGRHSGFSRMRVPPPDT